MKKLDYLKLALDAEKHLELSWLVSVLSILIPVVGPRLPAEIEALSDYQIVATPTGTFFKKPKEAVLEKLDDVVPKMPIFRTAETVKVPAGFIENLKEDVETGYGCLLANKITLCYAMGDKIPYINKQFSPADVEKIILNRFADDPKPGEPNDPEKIYVFERNRFSDGVFYLTEISNLICATDTERSLVTSPEIKKLRARLLEENKDRLDDPAVIAGIIKKLVEYDRDVWLKDDESRDFLISNKSFNVIRAQLFLMKGAEADPNNVTKIKLIDKSLSEGWDIDNFSAQINAMRAGSEARGAETVKGGEEVKWIFRAISDLRVVEGDCGSKLGIEDVITKQNADSFVGLYMITDGKPIKLKSTVDDSVDSVKNYFGKKVVMRSPGYCKLQPGEDHCSTCCGELLSLNPDALASAGSNVGSNFLDMFMALMHGKSLEVEPMNFMEVFS